MVYAKVNFVKTFELTATQSLLWYLREETLEMQIIISTPLAGAEYGGNNNNNNSSNMDSHPSGSSQRIVGAVQVCFGFREIWLSIRAQKGRSVGVSFPLLFGVR